MKKFAVKRQLEDRSHTSNQTKRKNTCDHQFLPDGEIFDAPDVLEREYKYDNIHDCADNSDCIAACGTCRTLDIWS